MPCVEKSDDFGGLRKDEVDKLTAQRHFNQRFFKDGKPPSVLRFGKEGGEGGGRRPQRGVAVIFNSEAENVKLLKELEGPYVLRVVFFVLVGSTLDGSELWMFCCYWRNIIVIE